MGTDASRRATLKWAEKNRKRISERAVKRREEFPAKAIFMTARQRAKQRGFAFDLTPEDCTVPEVCPVFGFKLNINSGKKGGGKDSPSIDRIDHRGGYTRGNIQIISRLANVMKADATPDQLITFAKWILKTYDQSNIVHP
jgi:hypothetical protein